MPVLGTMVHFIQIRRHAIKTHFVYIKSMQLAIFIREVDELAEYK